MSAIGATIRRVQTDLVESRQSTWRIGNAGGGPVTVTYELYGNELGRRSRHIDDSHAYLDASAGANVCRGSARRAGTVTLDVRGPGAASRGWTAMRRPLCAPNWGHPRRLAYRNGHQSGYHFTANGRDYDVGFSGSWQCPTKKQIVATSRKSYRKQGHLEQLSISPIFVHCPPDDGDRGATEHLNSTFIQATRYGFRPREDYLGFLSTTSTVWHTWKRQGLPRRVNGPYVTPAKILEPVVDRGRVDRIFRATSPASRRD